MSTKRRRGILSKVQHDVKRGKGGRTLLKYLLVLLQDPCVYCGEFGADSIDHIIPTSKWVQVDKEVGVNHWSNYSPAHKACNRERGTKPVFWRGLR